MLSRKHVRNLARDSKERVAKEGSSPSSRGDSSGWINNPELSFGTYVIKDDVKEFVVTESDMERWKRIDMEREEDRRQRVRYNPPCYTCEKPIYDGLEEICRCPRPPAPPPDPPSEEEAMAAKKEMDRKIAEIKAMRDAMRKERIEFCVGVLSEMGVLVKGVVGVVAGYIS